MSQHLCNIKDLPEFYCTLQDLLYKYIDPNNPAYLRKYLFVMPGKIPDLVRESMEEEYIDIEELSLTEIHEQIMTTLQKECIRRKTAKSVERKLRFDGFVCNIFGETYHFGCIKAKGKNKSCGDNCNCKTCKSKSYFRSKSTYPKYQNKKPRQFFRQDKRPRNTFFKKRQSPNKKTNCYIFHKHGH